MRKSLLLSLVALCAGGTQVQAKISDAAAERFEAIPRRNVFSLVPAEQPPAPATQPAALPKILLTGITTILGNKRALLKKAPPSAAGPGGKEESLFLTEGQREGEIEVLQIDEKAETVKVNNSGTVMTLTFQKEEPKSAPAAPGAGAPPGVSAGFSVPANAPAGFGATNGSPHISPTNALPSRIPRVGPGMAVPGSPNAAFPSALSPTGRGPVPPASLPPLPGQMQLQPQGTTPEEEAIIQEFQREAAARSAGALPQTAPSPGTPQAGVPTVVAPQFKSPSTVPAGASQNLRPQ